MERYSVVRAHPATKLALIIAAVVVAVDQLSKGLAVELLAGHGVVIVPGGLIHLSVYRNFAGSGNRLAGHPVLVSLLALLAVAALATGAIRVRSRIMAAAIGLMLGGGVGNLLDRILRAPGPLRGGVVDWLQPAGTTGWMNLADLAISGGVALVVIATLLGAWRRRARPTLPYET
jgi:signal peptidase II